VAERLFQIGVKGLIINEYRQILLVQDQKGRWDIPGGRMDQDESFIQTLTRELQEEIGAQISGEMEHFYTVLSNVTIKVDENEYGLVLVVYRVTLSSSTTFILGAEETAYEWVNCEVAADRLANKYPVEFTQKLITSNG
jgi:8-oxo-dGTP diphosphatase